MSTHAVDNFSQRSAGGRASHSSATAGGDDGLGLAGDADEIGGHRELEQAGGLLVRDVQALRESPESLVCRRPPL